MKVAVIIDDTMGIGLSTAKQFVAEDVNVFIFGRQEAVVDVGN